MVWTHEQTSGRGREHRVWWSDEGSWTFSLGIDPRACGVEASRESMLGLAVAVAVIDALESVTGRRDFQLRWPNDIEVGGRKLAGILPERFETPQGPRVVVGIGLNVATRLEEAPLEVQRMAVSLRGMGLEFPVPEMLLSVILAAVERWLRAIVTGEPWLGEAWNRLDSLRGRPIRVALGERVLEGRGAGIEPDGALRVEHDGQVTRLYGGQILRDAGSEDVLPGA
jgi:BirA family biotin operon repressor/biotin-[acetyl-CoA-carboxylase] ligase